MNDLQFTTNALATATRRTGPDGRDYLVAPGIALVAGVVGDEYVPADEIAKAAFGFSGRPLPLYHPMNGNEYISANSPELESTLSVGKFWNASFDGQRLKGEYWIDIAKAQALGGEALTLLQRLEANQQIETSTAYGRDLEQTPGQYQGRTYSGIARNLVPDHVAVLVNECGKCSIADGCGLLANSCGCEKCKGEAATMAVNEGIVEDAVKTGIMIAFYLPFDAANNLAMSADALPDGSEPVAPEQLHVTLAYLGKTDEVSTSEFDVMTQLAHFAKHAPVVRASVGGVGLFGKDNDGKQALWAQVDSAFLMDWRQMLTNSLDCCMPDEHGYTPHITLAYVPSGQPVTLIAPQAQELIFDAVALSWGNKTTLFPLQGEAVPINVVNSEEAVMSKDKDVVVADETVTESVAKDKAADEVKQSLAPNNDAAIVANAERVNAVSVELAATKAQLGKFVELFNDLGGVEKVRDIIQLAAVNAQAMAANAKREKDLLIGALVGNSRCAFSKVDLEKFDIDALGKLATSLQPADYSGRVFVANRMDSIEDDELYTLDELVAQGGK